MTKAIAIVCHKGGVGKTTTAASLGGYLSMKGERVLLIDLDAQQNLTHTFTNKGTFDGQETVLDAFERRRDLPVYRIRENLDLVPSSLEMCSFDNRFTQIGRENMLRKLLEPVRNGYDWVLLDCPASVGGPTPNALAAADYVVVPITADAYAFDGFEQIRALIQPVTEIFNSGLKFAGILMTRYNGRNTVDKTIDGELRRIYPGQVFGTRIRECSAFSKAPFKNADIFTLEPESNGAADYEAFALELVDVIARTE